MATKGYNLEQTGEQVQEALNKVINLVPATVDTAGLMSAADKEKLNSLPTGATLESSLGAKVDKVTGKGLSTNDFTNEDKSKLDTAYQVPSTGIPAADMSSGVQTSLGKANSAVQPADLVPITEKIPAQASAQNQLADKAFVNSSISTASADFKGTYDSLAELQAVTADKNDYGYVVSTDEAGNTVYSRYKYNGSSWVFEYDLNNSSFTAAEWASIQSQITAALVQKLSALPTNQELGQSLSGKQDVISDLSTIRSGAAAGATAYQKPATGIPTTDLASGVQTSLGKADSAYQKPGSGIPNTDMTAAVQASLAAADSASKREYNSQSPNGMGYLVLEKDKTFASQVTETNTIYEIRYDFVLTGNVSIPANCVLSFNGGSIGGAYTMTCNNTGIRAGMVKIFGAELTLSGSYCITEFLPEWFGATGDGNTDDTESIRKAIYTVNNHPVSLVFNSYKKYRVSDSLNYFNNSYFSVNTIIRGNAPQALKPDDCGILLVDKNASIFKSATISGEICGVNFLCVTTSHTTDASSMFYRCELRGLLFEGCRVTHFNSFLSGSNIVQVSDVRDNDIWAFYFAKTLTDGNNTYRCTLVDSSIDGNRIVGQSDEASEYQNVDNVCFEFSTYAGAYIRNNFIDYFRVIFDPGEIGCNGNINSIGNHYQVFRYFYKHIGATVSTASGSLNSIGDAFNWTKEENGQEEILDRYTKDTYTGYDGVTYNVPTYILLIENKEHIKIIDCILEGMLGNIVFINGPVQSDDTEIEFTCNVSGAYFSEHSGKIPVARHEGNPTDRNFLLTNTNLYKISLPKYCMDTVASLVLPSYRSQGVPTPGNYSKYLVGEKVIYSGSIYELQYLQRSNNSRFDWVKENSLPINILNADLDVIFNTIGASSFDLAFKFSLVFVKATASYNTVTSITIPNELRSIPLTIYNDGTLDVILSPVIVNGKAVVLKPKQCCVVIRPAYTATITCLANSSEISHSGTFANRPTGTDVYVGYQYFCTDRQTAEGAVDGITLTHKGSDVWVDALGRVVS